MHTGHKEQLKKKPPTPKRVNYSFLPLAFASFEGREKCQFQKRPLLC